MDAWTAAIARGDYQAAWAINDAVLAARCGSPDDPTLPYHLRFVWDGRPFAGRDALVRCYHGLGDTLQFLRYLPALRAQAASVTLEVQPELLPLLGDFPGVDRLVPFDVAHPLPPSECDLEIMELAHALRLPPEGVGVPYLQVPPPSWPGLARPPTSFQRNWDKDVDGWAKTGHDGGIALCARAGGWDADRSVPLPMLLEAIGSHPVTLLHRDPGNPADPLADIRATAAILAAAELVVTVDTMIAHLAGALGRPTWLLLKARPDWRWLEPGRVSRWYPATRLYRQRHPGDWRAPLAEVGGDLGSL